MLVQQITETSLELNNCSQFLTRGRFPSIKAANLADTLWQMYNSATTLKKDPEPLSMDRESSATHDGERTG